MVEVRRVSGGVINVVDFAVNLLILFVGIICKVIEVWRKNSLL